VHYLIDYDTRSVNAKSEDGKLLEQYISNSDLYLALAVISSTDELCIFFSFNELHDLYINIGGSRHWDDEEEIADAIWDILAESEDDFPVFTKKLGKKLLKDADKRNKEASVTTKPATKKPATQRNGIRVKDLEGALFTAGPKTPRSGAACCIFIEALEDNIGEATFDELISAFIESYVPKNPDKIVDDALARGYIRDAVNAGFIEEEL